MAYDRIMVSSSPETPETAEAHDAPVRSRLPDTDAICEVTVTADDPEWLASLARRLVEERLVACANIFPIRSFYRWDSTAQDHPEARAAFHTRLSLFDVIAAEVGKCHPYDLPALFAVPIVSATEDYRFWVLAETASPSTSLPVPDSKEGHA